MLPEYSVRWENALENVDIKTKENPAPMRRPAICKIKRT